MIKSAEYLWEQFQKTFALWQVGLATRREKEQALSDFRVVFLGKNDGGKND